MSIDSVRITLLEQKVEELERSMNGMSMIFAAIQNKVSELIEVSNKMADRINKNEL